jgi:hypothetical protein
MGYQSFFAYARERHAIYLRRQMGVPRAELTKDPILRQFRFCNVFRELDTTTAWFREHVREPLRDRPEVLLATVVYRWFNRIESGKVLWSTDGDVYSSPFEEFLTTGRPSVLRSALQRVFPLGPYVTGSYIIKTPDGMTKLDGVCWSIGAFNKARFRYDETLDHKGPLNWREVAAECLDWKHHTPSSMESMWGWLRQHRFIGDFMAYEIVSDLQHTDLLCDAPDIMTWANAGPGATRGLNRIHERPLNQQLAKDRQCAEMSALLKLSQSPQFWPKWDGERWVGDLPEDMDRYQPDAWPTWDMRTVEHQMCEWDKYLRVLNGEGTPRQKFKP